MSTGLSAEDVIINIDTSSSHSPRRDHRHSIKSFRHCSNFVFCFEFPDYCPICNKDLLTTSLKVPPSIYQSPFDSNNDGQLAVVIKPSRGKSFLHDYKDGDSLHCGLVDKDGDVHDFDEKGLHHSSEPWLNCVTVPIDMGDHFIPGALSLEQIKQSWSRQHPTYDAEQANCFTFVLFCLKALGCYTDMNDYDFIAAVIIPHTTKAARYISIYRSLVASGGIHISNTNK